MRQELRPLQMAVYAHISGNNKERCKTRGCGRLPSRVKAYQLWEETLIQTAGGQTGPWVNKTHYKISKRTGETPCVIGGGSQLLMESPLGLWAWVVG